MSRLVVVTAQPIDRRSSSFRFLSGLFEQAGLSIDLAEFVHLSDQDVEARIWRLKSNKSKGRTIPPDYVPHEGWRIAPSLRDELSRLAAHLRDLSPRCVLAIGDLPLWALCGLLNGGVNVWRGSRLLALPTLGLPDVPVIPILTPERVQATWEDRIPMASDLSRVERALRGDLPPPQWNVLTGPTDDPLPYLRWLSDLRAHLDDHATWVACDIETSQATIDCIGFAYDGPDGPLSCVIPFAPYGRAWDTFWSPAVFDTIQEALKAVLLHPKVTIVGQNFFYDAMWLQWVWGWHPPIERNFDTMIAHHALFVESPKSLDFLASLYVRDYAYWKDEISVGSLTRWTYCGKDCLATLEVAHAVRRLHERHGTLDVCDYQLSLQRPILATMMRGLRTHATQKVAVSEALHQHQQRLISELTDLGLDLSKISKTTGEPSFFNSPKQKRDWVLSQGLTIPKRRQGREHKESLDSAAFQSFAVQKPELLPLIARILAYTQCGKFRSTFIDAKPSASDGRMRTSYNIAGTDSYRLSSSKLLLEGGEQGCNLQNLPKGGKFAKESPFYVELPNVKALYVPDPAYPVMWDLDLDRADLQVVAWEADEAALKVPLLRGLDLHLSNARILFGLDLADSDLLESAPGLDDLKSRYAKERQLAKMACHAMNYGTGARTLARGLGKTIHEADKIIRTWFGALPGVERWHRQVERELKEGLLRAVTGHRRYVWGRLDLPKALAWKPQVTVGYVINTIWKRLDSSEPEIQVLAQVHDSLAGQSALPEPVLHERLTHHSRVVLPYEDPLVIPVGLKTSRESWGACREYRPSQSPAPR